MLSCANCVPLLAFNIFKTQPQLGKMSVENRDRWNPLCARMHLNRRMNKIAPFDQSLTFQRKYINFFKGC